MPYISNIDMYEVYAREINRFIEKAIVYAAL